MVATKRTDLLDQKTEKRKKQKFVLGWGLVHYSCAFSLIVNSTFIISPLNQRAKLGGFKGNYTCECMVQYVYDSMWCLTILSIRQQVGLDLVVKVKISESKIFLCFVFLLSSRFLNLTFPH